MSPLRVDLVEYDGARTPILAVAAEGLVLFFALIVILAALWVVAGVS